MRSDESRQHGKIRREKGGEEGGWAETLRTIVYALLIAFFVRTLAYQPFNIPSGSMIPTLLVGDYLFVSKFSYGYSRYSLPLGLGFFSGRILEGTPERGDIAVFRQPPSNRDDFVKRIVGLPGDRIQMIDGVFHLNGQPVDKRRIEDYVGDIRGRTQRAVLSTSRRCRMALPTRSASSKTAIAGRPTTPASSSSRKGNISSWAITATIATTAAIGALSPRKT